MNAYRFTFIFLFSFTIPLLSFGQALIGFDQKLTTTGRGYIISKGALIDKHLRFWNKNGRSVGFFHCEEGGFGENAFEFDDRPGGQGVKGLAFPRKNPQESLSKCRLVYNALQNLEKQEKFLFVRFNKVEDSFYDSIDSITSYPISCINNIESCPKHSSSCKE